VEALPAALDAALADLRGTVLGRNGRQRVPAAVS
jgi:hypothetical protein